MRFLSDGESLDGAIEGTYNIPMVTASVLVASVAAYAAFAFSERIRAARTPSAQWSWLICGALAMGIGVWAMHFTGMLAYLLPFSVMYDAFITGLSMIPAVLASGIALYVTSGPKIEYGSIVLGGIGMGIGISTMHYTGMEAMRMNAVLRYDMVLFTLSILVAIMLAIPALYLDAQTVTKTRMPASAWREIGAALVMGAAIAGMHYTAMTATHFFPVSHTDVTALSLDRATLAMSVISLAFAIIALLYTGTAVGRRLEAASLLEQEAAERGRAFRTLRDSEAYINAILSNTAECIITIDEDKLIESFNPAAETLFGYAADEVVGCNVNILMAEPQRSAHDGYVNRYIRTGEARVIGVRSREIIAQRKDGTLFEAELNISEFFLEGQRRFIGSLRDVSAQKQAWAQAAKAQADLANAIETISDGFIIFDEHSRLVMTNSIFRSLHPDMASVLAPGTLYEDFLRAWVSQQHETVPDGLSIDDYVRQQIEELFATGSLDRERYVGGRWLHIKERKTGDHGLVGVWSDITRLKEMQKQLELMAHHDGLTGLANRHLFDDRLRNALSRARRNQHEVALMYIDLDGFKLVNDSLGHKAGDAVLREIAQRLTGCVRETDTVARLGGDEFAVILEGGSVRETATAAAQRILSDLPRPIEVAGTTRQVSASIGVSIYPRDADSLETLISNADTAMYKVKEIGRNNVCFNDNH